VVGRRGSRRGGGGNGVGRPHACAELAQRVGHRVADQVKHEIKSVDIDAFNDRAQQCCGGAAGGGARADARLGAQRCDLRR
jgi:hypothetical protein